MIVDWRLMIGGAKRRYRGCVDELIGCLNNLRKSAKPARYACATYQSRRNGVVH